MTGSVCPSVRPYVSLSVACLTRPRKPTIATMEAHHTGNSGRIYLEVKRSKIKVTLMLSQTTYDAHVGGNSHDAKEKVNK